jgi:hypothetical protein
MASSAEAPSWVVERRPTSDLERRLIAVSGAAVLQLIQWWVFATILGQRYSYDGFVERHVAPETVLLAIALSLVPIAVLPVRMERPSTGILWVVYVLGLLPVSLYPPLVEGLPVRTLFAYEMLAVLSFCAVVWLVGLIGREWRGLPTRLRRRVIVASAMVMLAAVALLVKSFGIPTSFVALGDVYTRRLDFRTEQAASNPLYGYVIPWLQNVVAPILIVAGLARRQWLLIIAGCAIELWMYLTLGNRQALLGIVLVLLLYALFNGRFRSIFAPILLFGLAAGVALTTLYDRRGGSPYALSILVYRMFALPGVITGEYYRYFTGSPKVLGRDGLLGAFGHSPYDLPIGRLIGRHYFGNEATNANANVWADGFANFGLMGFVIVVVVLVPVLCLIDARVRPSEAGAVAAAAGFLCVGLANGSVLTVLLTGGLLPFAIVIAVTRGAVVARPERRSAQPANDAVHESAPV